MKKALFAAAWILASAAQAATGLLSSPEPMLGSLDQSDGFGWQSQPSRLAEAPAWRLAARRRLINWSYASQGYDLTSLGGEAVWGLGGLGALGISYEQASAGNVSPGMSVGYASLARASWGWAAGYGFSLGTGLALAQDEAGAQQASRLMEAGLGYAAWGQTLEASGSYSSVDGMAEGRLGAHGRLLSWLGWNATGRLPRDARGRWSAGLDLRLPLRVSAAYGDDGVRASLCIAWRGGRLAAGGSDREAGQLLSWQAWSRPAEAAASEEEEGKAPAIPDVDPNPAAPPQEP